MIGRKVLLLDTDEQFLRLTRQVFQEAGVQVLTAQDGMEGIGKALTHQPDLIILGTMKPGKDNMQVFKKIRQFSSIPLIVLSAKERYQLMLQGRQTDIDDILTKPINPEILLTRARSIMRRRERNTQKLTAFYYDDGHLKINITKHLVIISGRRVKLTPVEFRLLVYLVSNADKICSFEQILAAVWGDDREGSHSYVHVYISHLRGKIEEDTKKPRYIQSVHGVGYIFETHNKPASFEKALES